MSDYRLLLLAAALLLGGCQSRTDYGACVGLGDKQDPKLHYKASVRNIVLGIVFVEVIVPPVYGAVDEFYCPVGLETKP
jgi:hypothetical protein